MDTPDVDAWAAWPPREVAARLAGCPVTWFVAGGWAIDLHLGAITREHGDTEIAIPRTEFPLLRPRLAGFALYRAISGSLHALADDEEPGTDGHQVWVCDPAVRMWRLDVFLEAGDARTWVSHRDERIRRLMEEAVRRTAEGIPFLVPECVLLAKAKHARDKDEADLTAVLPTLDTPARAWLADALEAAHPGHRWIDRVRPA
jgi:Aminoglycoside-2''-adenylyltransferase